MSAQQSNTQRKGAGLLQSIDWLTVLLYVVLLGMGWMSVCGGGQFL